MLETGKIYHGDCMEFMKELPDGSVDLVLTDPPFGTGWTIGGGKKAGDFRANTVKEEWDRWDISWIDEAKRVCRGRIAFFFPLGKMAETVSCFDKWKLRFYIKTNPRPSLNNNDAPSVEPIIISPSLLRSKGPAHRMAYNGDATHPCQKPEAIVSWLIRDISNEGDIVLDPYLGSGSTVVVAERLKRRWIGMEADKRWCDLSRKRMDAERAQLRMF